jgi:beta-lactamase superfamily II metal-dependent hydrolase
VKQLGRFTKMAFELSVEEHRRIRLKEIEEAVFRNNLHELLCDHDGVIPLIVVLVEDGNKKNEVERRLKKRLELWTSQCIFYIPPVPKVITLDDNDFVYAEFVRDVISVCDGKYKDLLADLDSLAQKRAPCVFVRFASLLGLYPCVCDCSLEKATQLALELGTDLHFVLVIGDPGGLEEELCEQVFQVCRMAHLEDEEIKRIIDRMADERKTSYHYANLEKSRVVSLLLSPTVAELQEVLSNNVSLSLHIIYAGHAYDNGSWDISDLESFGESEIRKSLECVRFSHGIYLILDCCYAYKLFKDDVKKVLETRVDLLAGPEADAVRKCIKKAHDSDDQTVSVIPAYDDQFFEEQRSFTKTVVKLYKRGFQNQSENFRRLISVDIKLKVLGNLTVPLYLYPLSASHLDPQGAMSEFYGLKVNDDRISKRISGLLSRGKLVLERANVQILRPTVNPQLVCFPAGNGDSTLFRWHGFNMLIDGGRLNNPCFWPVVSRLPRTEWLDEVIVTHFDRDHILGILTMFKYPQVPIRTGRLHTTMPYRANPSGRSAEEGAKLVELAGEKDVECRNLEASTDPVIHVHFNACQERFNYTMSYVDDLYYDCLGVNCFKGDCLKVYMLTPGPSRHRTTVQQQVAQAGRGLSPPNMASASLLIHCRPYCGTSRFALLTGDAPCQPILEGLEKIIPRTNNKFQLHYADVPHHGSSKNNPKLFFSSIEASVVMISTNGSSHNHPDPETLLHLGKGLRDGRIKHACFTYNKEHERKNVSTCITEIPDNSKDKLLHFAPNKYDEKVPLKCTVIDLNGDALPGGFQPLGEVGYRLVNGNTDNF